MKLLIKNLIFTLLVPGSVAVYVPLIISRGKEVTSSPALLAISVILMLMGSVVYGWTVWEFSSKGGGTPLPLDPPRKLVVRGLYRYVRNPMYIGVIMVIFGWAGVFASGWLVAYAVGVWAIVHLFVTGYEEPMLKELFGTEYDAYERSIPRWLPWSLRK